MTDTDLRHITVNVAPDATGLYFVDIDIPDAHTYRLTPEQATEYADYWYTTATRAQYDAIVGSQMVATGVDRRQIAARLIPLPESRAELDATAIAPIELHSFIEVEAGFAALTIVGPGAARHKISIGQALAHSESVRSSAALAQLHRNYFQHLTRQQGLSADDAATKIDGLSEHGEIAW